MKLFRFLLIFSLLSPAFLVQAQNSKYQPDLKQGMILDFELYTNGEIIPITMKISTITQDSIVMDYNYQGNITGKFINSKNNLEKGTELNWDQPSQSEERTLTENQTIAMVSRTFLKQLRSEKKARYDGKDLLVKEIPKGSEIVMNGKEVDAIYAESDNGLSKYWILNNDKFPILLKIEGTAIGVDLTLKNIH